MPARLAAASVKRIDGAAAGGRDHDDARDAGHAGRHRVHQHRAGIGGGAARHIEADTVERGPAPAEPGAGLIGEARVFGQLAAVIRLDAAGGDVERLERPDRAGLLGRIDLGLRHGQHVGGEGDAIEFRRQRQQGDIAAGAHIGDDAAHDLRHIVLALAPGIQQRLEGVRENRARAHGGAGPSQPSSAWRGRPSAAHSPEMSLRPASMHSTSSLMRAAAGKHQLDLAARDRSSPLRRKADRQKRDHGIGLVAARASAPCTADHVVEMQARTARACRPSPPSGSD